MSSRINLKFHILKITEFLKEKGEHTPTKNFSSRFHFMGASPSSFTKVEPFRSPPHWTKTAINTCRNFFVLPSCCARVCQCAKSIQCMLPTAQCLGHFLVIKNSPRLIEPNILHRYIEVCQALWISLNTLCSGWFRKKWFRLIHS